MICNMTPTSASGYALLVGMHALGVYVITSLTWTPSSAAMFSLVALCGPLSLLAHSSDWGMPLFPSPGSPTDPLPPL